MLEYVIQLFIFGWWEHWLWCANEDWWITFCLQAEKVKFQLRLGQSKPIYNAFKAIRESPDWQTLSDARKRIVESKLLWYLIDMLLLWCDFVLVPPCFYGKSCLKLMSVSQCLFSAYRLSFNKVKDAGCEVGVKFSDFWVNLVTNLMLSFLVFDLWYVISVWHCLSYT